MPQQETEQGEINEGVVNGKLVRSAGRLSDSVTVSQACGRGFNAKVSKVRNTVRFVHEAAESWTESVLTGGPRAESTQQLERRPLVANVHSWQGLCPPLFCTPTSLGGSTVKSETAACSPLTGIPYVIVTGGHVHSMDKSQFQRHVVQLLRSTRALQR